jgi:hypothetical protein
MALYAWGLSACSGGGAPPPSDPVDGYPQITANYRVQSDATRTFTLSSHDDGQPLGAFTGSESLTDRDSGDQLDYELAGTWSGGSISFVLDVLDQQGQSAPVLYSGTLDPHQADRFTLKSSAEQIVLVRN